MDPSSEWIHGLLVSAPGILAFSVTGHCEPTARSLFLHGSVGNLATNPATIGWNDKIKSVDCRWDQL
ncbi:hypothetical protein AALT_g10895 [Alternaria alternata]|nr:hypothetical protein AALT_g10895 [Alternaria alternata]